MSFKSELGLTSTVELVAVAVSQNPNLDQVHLPRLLSQLHATLY